MKVILPRYGIIPVRFNRGVRACKEFSGLHLGVNESL